MCETLWLSIRKQSAQNDFTVQKIPCSLTRCGIGEWISNLSVMYCFHVFTTKVYETGHSKEICKNLCPFLSWVTVAFIMTGRRKVTFPTDAIFQWDRTALEACCGNWHVKVTLQLFPKTYWHLIKHMWRNDKKYPALKYGVSSQVWDQIRAEISVLIRSNKLKEKPE